MGAAAFWENRYGGRSQVWSGEVNARLAEFVSELTPGSALDLGCGEGGDAIWLAGRGWSVTAVDISTIAVQRGRAAADALGVGTAISWLARDLADWEPDGRFDLVTASFLQSPVELPRERILTVAGAAVAPGGHLLLVSHAAPPPWATQLHTHAGGFPTPAGEVAAAGLDAGWDVLVAEVRPRLATGPDGGPAHLDDTVVWARRR